MPQKLILLRTCVVIFIRLVPLYKEMHTLLLKIIIINSSNTLNSPVLNHIIRAVFWAKPVALGKNIAIPFINVRNKLVTQATTDLFKLITYGFGLTCRAAVEQIHTLTLLVEFMNPCIYLNLNVKVCLPRFKLSLPLADVYLPWQIFW